MLHKLDIRVKFTAEVERETGDASLEAVMALLEGEIAAALKSLPCKIKGKAKVATVRAFAPGDGKWNEVTLPSAAESD